MSSPFSFGTKILGAGALLLAGILVVGVLLPASWEVDVARAVNAPPAAIFEYLDSPEGWREWTPWPDSGLVRSGADRGVGASISWDDRELGSGSFTIVEAVDARSVTYAVEVSGGRMRTEGTLVLEPGDRVTRVTWHERGDLGRNPLMGYWARFMEPAQSAELEKSLERLAALAEGGASSSGDSRAPPPQNDSAPADTGSTGASR